MPPRRKGYESLADPRTFKKGFEHVKRNDAKLRPILSSKGQLRFQPEGEPFETLVESILSQQLAAPAASSIIKSVRELFPGGDLQAERLHKIDGLKLRGAGVSPQKLGYLKDLASRVVRGRIDLDRLDSMADDEIIETLDEVKGIGPWTVHMFLIFTLGRPDVLPVDDYGIKKSVQRIYRLRSLPNKAKLEALGSRWSPYRTVASLYLWHATSIRAE